MAGTNCCAIICGSSHFSVKVSISLRATFFTLRMYLTTVVLAGGRGGGQGVGGSRGQVRGRVQGEAGGQG